MRHGVAMGLAALVAAACADSTAPVPGTVSSVSVSPDSVSIPIGHTLQMNVVLLDSAGDTLPGRPVTWHSSDNAKASISATGFVTAHNYGPVTISATSDSVSGTATVRVLVPVARVDIPPFGATLVPGGGVHFTALLTGVDGSTLSDRDITWSSQTPGTTGVSATGVVTGALVGQTAITASSEGVTSAPATVVVTQPTFVALAAGGAFSCGLSTGGTAYCWGANDVGQLGRAGSGSVVPAVVSGGLQFAQIVAGELHACGLTTAGVAHCWGYNGYGQLGDGTKIDRSAPVRVQGQP